MDVSTYTTNLSVFVRDVRDYYSRCGHIGNDAKEEFTLPMAMVSYVLRHLSTDDQSFLFNSLYKQGFIHKMDDKVVTFSDKFVLQGW